MDKKRLILIFLVSFYIICACLNMYYLTSNFKIFYYGKHVSLLLFSLIVITKEFKNLKQLLAKVPKEIHLFSILFLVKTIINLFRLHEAKMGIYIIQDLSIILFFYAVLFTANIESFKYIQKYTFRITSILILATFLFSWINGITMFEIWARNRFIFGFDHPGYLGSLISVAVISSLSVIFRGKRNWFDLFLFSTMVIFLILNYSRNAILVVIVYSIILLILKKYKKINLKLIYTTLVSVVLITFLISYFFFDLINKISSLRLSIWLNFIKETLILHGDLWLGNGIWIHKDKDILSRMHVDNYNLEFIYESGLLLYILFFICLNLIFIYLSKVNKPYIKYSLASFVGIVFYGFFDSSFLTFGSLISVYLWFNILGGVGIYIKNSEREIKS